MDTVAAPYGSPAVLHLHRYYEAVRLLATHPRLPPVSLGSRYLPQREEIASSLGFLGNPCGNMPRARDSGGPVRPHPSAVRVQPSARITASASATIRFRS